MGVVDESRTRWFHVRFQSLLKGIRPVHVPRKAGIWADLPVVSVGEGSACFLSPYIIFCIRLPTSGTGGIRTHDLSVNSRLLFLLSFSPKEKTPLDSMIQRRSLIYRRVSAYNNPGWISPA